MPNHHSLELLNRASSIQETHTGYHSFHKNYQWVAIDANAGTCLIKIVTCTTFITLLRKLTLLINTEGLTHGG